MGDQGVTRGPGGPPHRRLTLISRTAFAGYSSLGHHEQTGQQHVGNDGSCFWQEESYDHRVRIEREFEENPVRAGWVGQNIVDFAVVRVVL